MVDGSFTLPVFTRATMRACVSSALRVVAGTWIGVVYLVILWCLFEILSKRWSALPLEELFNLLTIEWWMLLCFCAGLALIRWADRLERPPLARPGPPRSRRLSGYLLGHWRGEQSLARSLWVNTVLVALAYYGFWVFVSNQSDALGLVVYRVPILYGLTLGMLPWVGFVPLTVWQLVGLTRTATRAVNGLASFWSWDGARTVRMLAALALLAACYPVYFHAVPEVYDSAMLIRDDLTDRKYTLTVKNGGMELEMQGVMTFGLTEDVARILAEHPGIRMITLNSPGGRVIEGEALLHLIRAHRLVTYSSSGCHSACGLAFIGGTKRYLYKDARLGVHHSWSQSQRALGIDTSEALTMFNALTGDRERLEKLYFLEAGVDREFAEQLFANLTVEEMRTPSPQDLLRAGVVHGVVEHRDFVL